MMDTLMGKSNILAVLTLGIGLATSCSRSASSPVLIEMGAVERVNGCHVKLDLIRYHRDGSPMGDFHFVCDVAESALKEKEWWGDQPRPLMNSMNVGDCMRLKKTWYCVEAFNPGKSVTIKATFQTIDSDVTLIERVK